MSTDPLVTQEMIAAYADGELAGEQLALVEAAVTTDPALADLVAKHRALKEGLGAHFAPVLDAPVPSHLTAMLQPRADEANVVSLADERRKRGFVPMVRRWAPIAGPALAASLILALWQPWQGTPKGYAEAQLATVLDKQLVAEQPSTAPTRILLSFANGAGQYCRAYRGATAGGIACRDDNGWRIERAFAVDAAKSTEYRQAGSDADILAAAQELAAGEALDAEAEAQAMASGWR